MTEAARKAKNEYMKNWRKNNRDKCNNYLKTWRGKNPDKIKEYNNKYWENKVG